MCSRTLEDTLLTLSASGWTYLTRFILYDYETESMWFPLDNTTGLTAVAGPHADHKLEAISSKKTTWNLWKAANPESKYMEY